MPADILCPEPLIGPVAQQLIADKFLDHCDLVVHRAGAACNAARLVIIVQCPEWHGRYPPNTEILDIVLIQIALQNIEWNAGALAGPLNKLDLLRDPGRLDPKVAVYDGIIPRHFRVPHWKMDLLTRDQRQCCTLHPGATAQYFHF